MDIRSNLPTQNLWQRLGSNLAEKWEIYLLITLSVVGIAIHYIQVPEAKDPLAKIDLFQHTLEYLILMMCLLSIHLIRQESKNHKRLVNLTRTVSFEHKTLEDAIKIARDNHITFKKIRVLASTSANIQPLLMITNHIIIESCSVLLVQDDSENADALLRHRVATFIDAWKDNQTFGKIKNLSIKGYNFIPLLYVIIFDNTAMVLGLMSEDKNRRVRMDVGEPIVVKDDTVEGVKLIVKWIDWFDRLEERLPQHQDFIPESTDSLKQKSNVSNVTQLPNGQITTR